MCTHGTATQAAQIEDVPHGDPVTPTWPTSPAEDGVRQQRPRTLGQVTAGEAAAAAVGGLPMQGGCAARASEQGGQVEEEGRLDGVRHASGRKMQHPGQ